MVVLREFPDDIRVPLHSLQSDAGYLFGRVAADGSVAGAMAESVRSRLSQTEEAIMSNMRALQEKHTSLAIRADQYRNERDAALRLILPTADRDAIREALKEAQSCLGDLGSNDQDRADTYAVVTAALALIGEG